MLPPSQIVAYWIPLSEAMPAHGTHCLVGNAGERDPVNPWLGAKQKEGTMKPTTEQIAIVCHETNRAWCDVINDSTQKPWDQAEQWQRESAIKGVEFAIANPDAKASAQHDAWCSQKLADGWKYGPVKDSILKQHPCLVPYDGLPIEQQRKDALFRAVVKALTE